MTDGNDIESDARREKIETTRAAIKKIVDVDPASLSRKAELSRTINFEAAVPHFERMIDVFRELGQRDIASLTTRNLDAIAKAADNLQGRIDSVRSFDLNTNSPGDVCAQLIQQVVDSYDGIVEPLLLPLAFTSTQATDYARIEREAKGHNAELKKQFTEMSRFIEKSKEGAQRALAAVQEQAAEAGVSTNAQVFKKEAEERGSMAANWKTATIGMIVLAGLVALATLATVVFWTPESTQQAIQYVAAKLLLISVLSFATVWCARNYRSHKHNETLNLHRAHALMTFRAFVEGTSDDRVKDAVLVQAANAAFHGRPSGYEDADATPQVVPILDMVSKSTPQV